MKPTVHELFGKELDCPSVVTATHTHTVCYKMAFELHPHLGCSYHLYSDHIFPLGVWLMLDKIEIKKKKEKALCLVGFYLLPRTRNRFLSSYGLSEHKFL